MKTAFISGHLKISEDEFTQHYVPLILNAINEGHHFVVGDARGVDSKAQLFLQENNAPNVTIYHMFTSPRNFLCNANLIGNFTTDDNRDEAMTYNSDYDIAWVRPGRENSGTQKNIDRRTGTI